MGIPQAFHCFGCVSLADDDLSRTRNLLRTVLLDPFPSGRAVDLPANTPEPFIVIFASYELRFDLVEPLFDETGCITDTWSSAGSYSWRTPW